MNPVEMMLKKLQAAHASPSGHAEIWVPKKDFVEQKLPEKTFEHFDVHPAMKSFWKSKDDCK